MRARERSMNVLRKMGYMVACAEYWSPFDRRRHDLFGFADLIALPEIKPTEQFPDKTILAIQCVNTHLREHIEKIQANDAAKRWLLTGNDIIIHEWRKLSANGRGSRKVWKLREHAIRSDGRVDVFESMEPLKSAVTAR